MFGGAEQTDIYTQKFTCDYLVDSRHGWSCFGANGFCRLFLPNLWHGFLYTVSYVFFQHLFPNLDFPPKLEPPSQVLQPGKEGSSAFNLLLIPRVCLPIKSAEFYVLVL